MHIEVTDLNIYEYDRNIPFNLSKQRLDDHVLLSFDAVYEPDVPEAKRVLVHYYEAENPWMNLIFLHGIGNGHIRYLMWFGKYFAKQGINVYFLIHPYHLERGKPEWTGGEPFYHHSPAHCIVRFHQAIKDVRRTMDLIESSPESAKLPTSLMGFSFGGMIATMTLALDKRLKSGILAFTGGDWRWLNWHSPYLGSVREGYAKYSNEWGCKDEELCVKLRSKSRAQIAQLKSIDDIFTLTPSCFHYDPLSYAKFVSQPVLMFQGIFDKIIPAQSYAGVYELLPNAKKVTIPSGHKSSYVYRRIIGHSCVKFFEKNIDRKMSEVSDEADEFGRA